MCISTDATWATNPVCLRDARSHLGEGQAGGGVVDAGDPRIRLEHWHGGWQMLRRRPGDGRKVDGTILVDQALSVFHQLCRVCSKAAVDEVLKLAHFGIRQDMSRATITDERREHQSTSNRALQRRGQVGRTVEWVGAASLVNLHHAAVVGRLGAL